jgi:hypothetical protein
VIAKANTAPITGTNLNVVYLLMITAPLFDQTLCPSKPARAIQSLVRAHWLTTVGGVVNRFTGITQTRHFVMAITVDDSAADPQTRRCWQRRRREKGAHSMDTLAARRKC